jgi:hypothetical protein
MTNTLRRAALALATLALVLPVDADALPYCPTEDSVSCYWDAATQGNGAGRSAWYGPDAP